MRTPKLYFLSGFVLCSSLVAGCGTSQDDSMYLTGTEEYAVTLPNGQVGCTNPKKELVCHIPPGNPGNAHDICVGKQAVEPHQRLHGDTIGACAPADVDAGVGSGSDDTDAGGGGGDGTDGGVI
jgi:hypothetical protein